MQTKLIDQRGFETKYGLLVQTQNKLHDRGLFAPRIRIGHKWHYRRSLLEKWLDKHTVVSTPRGVEVVAAPADSVDEAWKLRPQAMEHFAAGDLARGEAS